VLVLSTGIQGAEVQYKPLSLGASSEFGMLQSGRFGSNNKTFTDEWVDNFSAYMIQSAESERWTVNVGIGGVFQYQKPEVVNAVWGGTQYRSYFIGPAVADFEYLALETPTQKWMVGMGMFNYKYNPQASNLGEYLFRSGPYPTYVMTGAYGFINNSAATLQGAKSRFTAGNFSADLFLTTETTMPPMYDLSLAGVVKYTTPESLLTAGLGVNLKRLVSVRPSKTQVKSPSNAWFTGPDGAKYAGNPQVYGVEATFYERKLTAARTAGSIDTVYYSQKFSAAAAKRDSVTAWVNPTSVFKPSYAYYDLAGQIVDVMLTLDIKKLFPGSSSLFGPEDLKIFAEAALLGISDYPIFYENKADRIPVMAGINLPGFRFFDLISLQFEYFPSPHINSYASMVGSNYATPAQVDPLFDPMLSGRDYADQLSKDDFSWSLLVQKTVGKRISVAFQAARDHARLVSETTWAGPFLDPNEVFYKSGGDNWYWMMRVGFGI
jgi:hypothetical protein